MIIYLLPRSLSNLEFEISSPTDLSTWLATLSALKNIPRIMLEKSVFRFADTVPQITPRWLQTSFFLSTDIRCFVSIIIGFTLMCSIGSGYSICSWERQMKEYLGLDQSEIASIASSASFGAYVSFPPGLFYDRLGIKASIIAGGLLISSCYILVYLFVEMWQNHRAPLWLFDLIFILVGQGTGLILFAAVGSNEGNFGEFHRSKILGLLFAGYPLGGVVFAWVFHSLLGDNLKNYFAFMAFELFFVCLLGYLLLFRRPEEILEIKEEADYLLQQNEAKLLDELGINILSDLRFWELFVVIAVGSGSSLLVMMNIPFILESLGGNLANLSSLVRYYCVCNLSSRVLFGFSSDYWHTSMTRGMFLSIAIVFSCLSHLSLALFGLDNIVISVCLSGIAGGGVFATFPVIIREMFGREKYGFNFGCANVANAIGYPLILAPLSTIIYNGYAMTTPNGVQKCVGKDCFQPTFWICVICSAIALVISKRLHSFRLSNFRM